jgi:hypothetical protein
MAKKYTISIPEPCNEKWEEMTPTEKGRYCAVCKTEIYDFTNLTHRELAEKLKRNENVCAKYRPDQLDVDLFAKSDINLSKVAMVISLTTAVGISAPAIAQETKAKTEQTIVEKDRQIPQDSTQITIKGLVKDHSDQTPLPGANVVIKGTDYNIATDYDGLFSITIPHKDKAPITLVFSYVGYSDKEFVITDFTKSQEVLLVELEMSEAIMGIVVVHKRSFFQRIGDWFKRTFSRKKKEPKRSCEVKY